MQDLTDRLRNREQRRRLQSLAHKTYIAFRFYEDMRHRHKGLLSQSNANHQKQLHAIESVTNVQAQHIKQLESQLKAQSTNGSSHPCLQECRQTISELQQDNTQAQAETDRLRQLCQDKQVTIVGLEDRLAKANK